MNQEELNKALYEKMSAEQERFKHNLLGMTPEEVLDHAYEYAMRQDILIEMEALDLPAPQAAALLASPFPLADVYKDFGKIDTGHMENVRECIEQRADDLLEQQREKTRAIPLYQQSGEYAREHGELDTFRASRKANIACRDAIEQTIWEGFDGMHLTADPKDVLAEFGPERVSYVLAATLRSSAWDKRFSSANQMWAAAIPMAEPEDRRISYHISNHSTVLDGFVSMVRKELAAAKEQPEQTAEKPSIKEQLVAKPVPGDHPAKPKEQEVTL